MDAKQRDDMRRLGFFLLFCIHFLVSGLALVSFWEEVLLLMHMLLQEKSKSQATRFRGWQETQKTT